MKLPASAACLQRLLPQSDLSDLWCKGQSCTLSFDLTRCEDPVTAHCKASVRALCAHGVTVLNLLKYIR